MLERLIKLKYIILFLVIVYVLIVASVIIYYNYEKKMFLEDNAKLSKIEYEAVYNRIKELSETIFEEYINKKEIIDEFKNAHISNDDEKQKIRKNLYAILAPDYNRLHKLIDLRQVHFHLPNNHSFLRMHRPSKFGDNLTKIRSTVEYVNKFKKRIDGFEEGRAYNGFRFVYPLFNENKVYIGSVEVSFSTALFQKSLSNDIRYSQFIVSKKVIDQKVWKDDIKINYDKPVINEDFLIESNLINDKYAQIKTNVLVNMPQEIKDTFNKNNRKKENSFSLLLNIDDLDFAISFLAIKNPVTNEIVAYLLVFTQSTHLKHICFQNNIVLLITFSLLLSLFIIIYIKSKNNDESQEQKNILMEQSRMAQMGSMINNIAHQWKQPLARINSKLLEISILFNRTKENKYMNKHLEDIEATTLHMANTIENFRTFFHPNKEKNNFDIKQTIQRSISLLNFDDTDIDIIIDIKDSVKIYSYENELIQVLMILITNAKEALEDKDVTRPFISISVVDKISTIEIIVIDNAGGIKDEILKEIFNPYFTTKEMSDNSGLGLYIAKMIVNTSIKGKITYKKEDGKSNFCIVLKELK